MSIIGNISIQNGIRSIDSVNTMGTISIYILLSLPNIRREFFKFLDTPRTAYDLLYINIELTLTNFHSGRPSHDGKDIFY